MNDGKKMSTKKWVASAFETRSSQGSSMNKWIALWLMVLVTLLHIKYLNAELKDKGDFSLIPQFLWCDLIAIGILLGLVHTTDIIAFLNRDKSNGSCQINGNIQQETRQEDQQIAKKED